ncbi:MAG TPA: transcription antitermination factor NusB, partial [Myxococcota bacterium]|nr:transcription antitermination factor NusB [Myxococcota bacterium]
WRLGRMPVVDRNILRIGAWELGNRKDIPVSVSINEAIELAKRFGGAESRAFVNGILDRIAAEVGRGGRKGRG